MKFNRLLKLIFQTDYSIAWITPEGKYVPYTGGSHRISFLNFKLKKQQKELDKLDFNCKNLVRVFNLLGQFGFSWNDTHTPTSQQQEHIKTIGCDFFNDNPEGKCYIEIMDNKEQVISTKHFENYEELNNYINYIL